MNFGEKEFSTFCDLRDRWNDIQYTEWKTDVEKEAKELEFAREIKAFPFHASYRFFIFLGEGGYWGYGDPSLDRIGELFATIEHEDNQAEETKQEEFLSSIMLEPQKLRDLRDKIEEETGVDGLTAATKAASQLGWIEDMGCVLSCNEMAKYRLGPLSVTVYRGGKIFQNPPLIP